MDVSVRSTTDLYYPVRYRSTHSTAHPLTTYSSERNISGRDKAAGGSSAWRVSKSPESAGTSKPVELPDAFRSKIGSEFIPLRRSMSTSWGVRGSFCCGCERRCSSVAMVHSVSLEDGWSNWGCRSIPNLVSRAFTCPFFGPRCA